jgi:hypothetical protein
MSLLKGGRARGGVLFDLSSQWISTVREGRKDETVVRGFLGNMSGFLVFFCYWLRGDVRERMFGNLFFLLNTGSSLVV